MMDACGVVLAGGRSTRMGTDKALLPFGNETLIERSVRKLQALCPEVLVVGRRPGQYPITGIREIWDIYPDHGPLGGIHAALTYAVCDRVLITACDMPFWEPDLARLLVRSSLGHDAAIPRIGAYVEPLLAVYAKSCLKMIETLLDLDHNKVSDLYALLNVNFLSGEVLKSACDPDTAFLNLNKREDWLRLVGSASDRGSIW